MKKSLSVSGLKSLIEGHQKLSIIDVRKEPAYKENPTVIPGGIWRNPEDVSHWRNEIPSDVPVLVYCVHGHEVSQGVADNLDSHGHEVYFLAGGYEGWLQANK